MEGIRATESGHWFLPLPNDHGQDVCHLWSLVSQFIEWGQEHSRPSGRTYIVTDYRHFLQHANNHKGLHLDKRSLTVPPRGRDRYADAKQVN